MQAVEGRVAVVTGAAGGIGSAMVDRFATAGMNMVVTDLDGDGVERTAAAARERGVDVAVVVGDASSRAGVDAILDVALDAFGTVNVLCANAGVVRGGRVEELTEEEWSWILDVDLWGPIHAVRAFLPVIEASGEGHLLATASTSALVAPLFNAPYSVAKAGVIALMETVRRELDDRRSPIGASVLCPSSVNTDLIARSESRSAGLDARSVTDGGRQFAERSSAGLAQGLAPRDVADMVLDAILTNRFWILTHPEWGDILRWRAETMATTGELAGRTAGPVG